MRIIALRTSQQLDYKEIGSAVGIDSRTANKVSLVLHRVRDKKEVAFIYVKNGKLYPIEIKKG